MKRNSLIAIIDEEVGDEVERIEAVPCRRCVDGAGR